MEVGLLRLPDGITFEEVPCSDRDRRERGDSEDDLDRLRDEDVDAMQEADV